MGSWEKMVRGEAYRVPLCQPYLELKEVDEKVAEEDEATDGRHEGDEEEGKPEHRLFATMMKTKTEFSMLKNDKQ